MNQFKKLNEFFLNFLDSKFPCKIRNDPIESNDFNNFFNWFQNHKEY